MTTRTSRALSLDLAPIIGPRDAGLAAELLPSLLSCGFDAERGYELATRYADEHHLHDLIDPSALRTGGVLARERLLWPVPFGPWFLRADAATPASSRVLRLDVRALPTVGEAFRSIGDPDGSGLLGELLGEPYATGLGATELWGGSAVRLRPGLHRGPHAELLIASEEACVVVDPIRLSSMPAMRSTSMSFPPVDAVLFTHGHGDHFHLPTLLAVARHAEVPVLCPDVPTTNLLTRSSFAEQLRACGQRALVARPGLIHVAGDIRIEPMPFHGEQPTAQGAGPDPRVRNWGCTYWVETPQMRLAVLADAGRDPSGDMADVVSAVAERRGPPDVVVSCLRTFPSPFYGGLPLDWLTLDIDQLRALERMFRAGVLPPVTLGPKGLAELASRAGARWAAPYAHGLAEDGGAILDIGWGEGEPSEESVVRDLEHQLAALDGDARALRWNVGEHANLAGSAR